MHGQFSCFRYFPGETHAPRAENAPFLVQDDIRPDRKRLLPLLLILVETRIVDPVVHVIVLELAFAGLVAHRTVEGMVDEQEFED